MKQICRFLLCFQQLCVLTFTIATGIHSPIADVGIEPEESLARFSTFRGSEAMVHWTIPNTWIGSSIAGLISECVAKMF